MITFKQGLVERRKNYFLITLIIIVFAGTFVQSIRMGLHQLSQSTPRNLMAISVAISDLEYGAKGYTGYTKVLKAFLNRQEEFVAHRDDKNSNVYDNSIKEALNIDDVASEGLHVIFDDVGLASYHKLAFMIFGYKAESSFYLYFLLMAISIALFSLTFHNNSILLNILLLFVCSHFVVVMLTPMIGRELQVANNRFFPVLSVLPSFYVALFILGERKICPLSLLGAIVQAAIVIFVIHARANAFYQIFFILGVFFLAVIWHWSMTKNIRNVFTKVHAWPIAIVLVGLFLLKTHLIFELHPAYKKIFPSHNIWGAALIGLSANPDNKNGDFSDLSYYIPVQRRAIEKGYRFDMNNIDIMKAVVIDGFDECETRKELMYLSYTFEKFARDEFYDLFKKDPAFILESFLYKFTLFFKIYFRSDGKMYYYFGALKYLLKWYLLTVILIGAFLVRIEYHKKWLLYFSLLSLQFVFALLPAIFFVPVNHVIADPGMLFTLMLYMGLSWSLCYIFVYIERILNPKVRNAVD